jgi:hypothetical protein
MISNLYHHPWEMLQYHPTLGKVNHESVLESKETSTLLNFGMYFGRVDSHSAMVSHPVDINETFCKNLMHKCIMLIFH